MRILFTGGGSGGHIFPIIATARQLNDIQSKEAVLDMYFLGAGGFDKQLLRKEGIKVKTILAGKWRRYFSIWNFLDLLKIPIGFCQALGYLYFWMPDVVFSKGGYDSAAVVLAAWLYRIPVLIHESDAVPGFANRMAAKFSKRIAVSFASAATHFPAKKTALIGNPVRLKIIQYCLSINEADKQKAEEILKIVSQKPIILILGGSQGAQIINKIVLSVLPQLLEKYEIIHQCGLKNYQEVKAKFGQSSLPTDYHLFSFLEEEQMAAAYLLADLIISRAGAGSIFEIAACAKPSILIPLLGAASDHQRENAFNYAQTGTAVVLEQANLTQNLFLNEITKILGNPELRQKMSKNAKDFSHPEAAQKIAEELIEMGK